MEKEERGIVFARDEYPDNVAVISIDATRHVEGGTLLVIQQNQVAYWYLATVEGGGAQLTIGFRSQPEKQPYSLTFGNMTDTELEDLRAYLRDVIFKRAPAEGPPTVSGNYLSLDSTGKIFTICMDGRKVQMAVDAIRSWSLDQKGNGESLLSIEYPGNDTRIGITNMPHERLLRRLKELLGVGKYKRE